MFRWILLKMRNISDESCRKNQNTHFMFNSFFPENRAVYDIMSKNMVEPDRPQMTIRRMCFARWITKATHTRKHTHTHTLRIFNTHCFFTATAVSRTHLNAALYVYCDFCYRNTQHCRTFALCVHFLTTHFCKQLWCMSDLVFAPRVTDSTP